MMLDATTRRYECLIRHAERGAPCPTNIELEDESGSYNVSSSLGTLQRNNLITIQKVGRRRTITIVETGATTGLSKPTKIPSNKILRKRGPSVMQPRVNRNPCEWCGARGDYGCGHAGIRLVL